MSPSNNPAEPTLEAPASGVTVRMYDLQGEGDCFLLGCEFFSWDELQGQGSAG